MRDSDAYITNQQVIDKPLIIMKAYIILKVSHVLDIM